MNTTVSSRAESLLPIAGVAIFFLAFAGQGVRNTFGWLGFGIITVLVLLACWVVFFLAGRRVKDFAVCFILHRALLSVGDMEPVPS